MHNGPILGRIGSFWVFSDKVHIVFSSVSDRLWVVLGRPDITHFYRRRPGSSVVCGRLGLFIYFYLFIELPLYKKQCIIERFIQ